jgi:type 1 glutamine amidotransferase
MRHPGAESAPTQAAVFRCRATLLPHSYGVLAERLTRLVLFLCLMAAGAAAEEPLRVVIFAASKEYRAAETLPQFKAALEQSKEATAELFAGSDKGSDLRGFDILDKADVAVVFTRRVKLGSTALDQLKAFCAAGKGVVGIRTASHAFEDWPTFDREILGGDYQNHRDERAATLSVLTDHFILKGFTPFPTSGKLYKNPKPAEDIVPLLRAKTDEAVETVAWARERGPQRVFYTSLGIPEDFAQPSFVRMLVRATFWTAHRESSAPPDR